MKPVLFDLCCKAGGCSKGYQQAGFYVVGVDIEPRPRYIGDEFIQMDALKLLRILIAGGYVNGWCLADIAAFSASPPCQGYSRETPMAHKSKHPRLIGDFRKLLQATGRPYIIENVEDARRELVNPIKLCGSMFGLPIWRHRYFEMWPDRLLLTPGCQHNFAPVLITGTPRRKGIKRADPPVALRRQAIDIDWMVTDELDEAIPPAYTHWIGNQIMSILQPEAA